MTKIIAMYQGRSLGSLPINDDVCSNLQVLGGGIILAIFVLTTSVKAERCSSLNLEPATSVLNTLEAMLGQRSLRLGTLLGSFLRSTN